MRKILAAMAIALFAQPAFAQDTANDPAHELAAWKIALDMHGGKFTSEQQNALIYLAWHIAVGNMCDDIHVDLTKYGQALADLEHSDGPDVTDEEHRFFEQHVLSNLGVAVGIILAEHADSPESTCKLATELIEKAEVPNYFDTDTYTEADAQ